MAEREIAVASFNTETEALMWAELLKNEGIPSVLVPLGASVAAFGPSVWRPFELRVRESDVDRARRILPD